MIGWIHSYPDVESGIFMCVSVHKVHNKSIPWYVATSNFV